MANTFAPFGLRSFGRMEGGAPTAGLTRAFIRSSDTVAVFTGDTVRASTIVAAAGTNYVTQDSSGVGLVRGVFMGCEYYSPTVGRVVWSSWFPGSVQTSSGTADAIAYIIDDPDQLFIAQLSTTSVAGTSNVGSNIGTIPSSAGSQVTGISALSLASSLITASASWPFRIVDTYSNYAPPGVNGIDLTAAGAILVVAPNNWERKNLTARTTQ